MKLCACGCGQELISKDLKGRPTRYIIGHHIRLVKGKHVTQYTMDGKYIKTYPSGEDAAKATGVLGRNLRAAASGRRWNAGGYLWNYTDVVGNLKDVTACQCCGKKVGLDNKVTIALECLQRFKQL